jgi:esterase/lipase superfamily enzyme
MNEGFLYVLIGVVPTVVLILVWWLFLKQTRRVRLGRTRPPRRVRLGRTRPPGGSVARRARRLLPSPGGTPAYPLWFGTNRQPIDPQNLSLGFSCERGDQLHYGVCQANVPRSHKIGSIGSPWWRRLLTWTDDRLTLDWASLKTMAEAEYWADVKQALLKSSRGQRVALVYLHGFNVSFEAAALRAAQIGWDLKVPGLTAFYSWPSKGEVAAYFADGESVDASEEYITHFLTRFVEESGAECVHLIAHSMGNRVLLRAVERMASQAQAKARVPFGQIILAAPDVDHQVFRSLATAYRQVCQRTTLYVSSKDLALASSGIVYDYPRAGFVPPVTILPGIDTVEVSNIDLTLLGHGYYAGAHDVLQDIHALLLMDQAPEQRFGLRVDTTDHGERYWVITR